MSASPWGGISQYTGTPKTLDNTIENLWQDSSQAQWCCPCFACNHRNIPSLAEDLERMMGPTLVTREISRTSPALVCAKCGRPLDSRAGYWVHGRPELRYDFDGRHVPQCIMPMHCEDPEMWAKLQAKRQGFGRTPYTVFLNECCGESADYGAKLLTSTDLKRAADLPWDNKLEEAVQQIGNYQQRMIGVDWGGGGLDETSFTTAAVVGMLPDGKLHVLYGWRSLTPNDPIREAIQILHLMHVFRCSHLCHDFCGAGALRETLIAQAGLPENRIIPVAYQRVTSGPMMGWKPFNVKTGKRAHHQLDKARAIQYICELIKTCYIRFFQYDFHGSRDQGLLHDFLALVEDLTDARNGPQLFTIIRNKMLGPDDFVHAVVYPACSLFHARGQWPDVALDAKLQVTPELLNAIAPIQEVVWDDMDY